MDRQSESALPEEAAPSDTRTVVVLMGGKSAERDVSLVTGEQVAGALEQRGLKVLRLDLDEELVETLRREKPSCVFIALHGRLGEDGAVQGLLEVLGVPYTGSGILASALAMDKVASKKIFCFEHIPTPQFVVVRRDEPLDVNAIVQLIGMPTVVKPACEGSAIGVSIVREQEFLPGAVDRALACGDEVLLEQYVTGTEITVGVLDEEEPKALPTIEIVPANEMYDYESKYTPGKSEHIIPARIPEEAEASAKELAVRAHRALGCSGFSRVDFIVTREGEPFALEVNTIPGMTGTSLFPEAAKAAGIEFEDLIERLVAGAIRTRGA